MVRGKGSPVDNLFGALLAAFPARSLLLQMLHAARSVCMSVCWAMSCAKTTERIEMPFVVLTGVCPMNHVLDGG